MLEIIVKIHVYDLNGISDILKLKYFSSAPSLQGMLKILEKPSRIKSGPN